MVGRQPLRIVFFGTPEFAVPTLEALLASPHRVAGVVTQPDRPRGRGQRTVAGPVKIVALAAGLPVLQPDSLKTAQVHAEIAALGADLGVVAAYGKLLPDAVLKVPPHGMLNVHASLLPKYRGAAPIHRAVMAGDEVTGVTIMRVVKALDAGPMLAAEPEDIGPDDTSVDVERRLAAIGATLLVATVDRLVAGRVVEAPQDDTAATYASRIMRDEGLMHWSDPASVLHNRVRGLYPWPHAHTFSDGMRLIILRTAVVPGRTEATAPGTVVRAHGDELIVAAGRDQLRVLEVQVEGRRPAHARDFLAGYRIRDGHLFSIAP